MLLLDTHVWIWSREGDERRMGRATRRLLDRSQLQGLVSISPLSLFEVTALHLEGRLHLNRPPEQWVREAVGDGEIRLAELTMEMAIDAGHIPRAVLGDPSDRLLVATARRLDATLVTADRAILAYARGGHVRVHDASR